MSQRRKSAVTANFPGAATPVGSVVRFRAAGSQTIGGRVTRLRLRVADVLDDDGNEWSVPYRGIREVINAPKVQCTLGQIERLAQELMAHHASVGGLEKDWSFGFDLATARAGVCRYNDRRIDLSVSYCLAANRAEIVDTVLHEIAHAIVGPRHNHDSVWRATAQRIGCTGERCHRVQHSAPKWVGECGCGQRWFRQTLQRRIMRNRMCAKCHGTITWRRNSQGLAP